MNDNSINTLRRKIILTSSNYFQKGHKMLEVAIERFPKYCSSRGVVQNFGKNMWRSPFFKYIIVTFHQKHFFYQAIFKNFEHSFKTVFYRTIIVRVPTQPVIASSKLTMEVNSLERCSTLTKRQHNDSNVNFNVNSTMLLLTLIHISHLILVFLLLTLSR